MKFIADHMLGSLARWMRFFGFDTLYPDVLDDKELRALAERKNRILLTRDKDLANARGVETLYIGSTDLDEQLIFVITTFDLKVEKAFSRCGLCNSILVSVDKESVEGKVPEKVFEWKDEYWFCEKCNKYYWQGTHYKGIEEKIKALERKTPTA
jgi:uncharacterized protein with PIN domain